MPPVFSLMMARPLMVMPLLHRVIPRRGHLAAGIVGAVAGHVDDPAHGGEAGGGELRHGIIDAVADRRAAGGGARRVEQDLGEFGGPLAVADHHPFRDHGLLIGSRPFDEAERNGPVRARLNGLQELRTGHRLGVAAALQLEIRRRRCCAIRRRRERSRRRPSASAHARAPAVIARPRTPPPATRQNEPPVPHGRRAFMLK